MRPIRTFTAFVLLAWATLLIGAPPASAISDACVFDAATATVHAYGGVPGFVYHVGREAGTTLITFIGSGGSSYCLDGPKQATVKNTDTIVFSGSPVHDVLGIDLSGGPLAPGKTAEGTGASEIEIELAFLQGSDRLDVWGSEGDDTVAFVGTGGARLNGDTDKDVTISGLEYRTVYGYGGDDAISSETVPIYAYGGDGNDSLVGSDAWDRLYGAKGNDTLAGNDDDDTLRGDQGRDVLEGGGQMDSLYPGTGNDTVNGGADDDTIYTDAEGDGADVLLGGPGSDDAVYYSQRVSRVVLDLDGLADDGAPGEGDLIGKDVEHLGGGAGNDSITGSPQENYLYGEGGKDTIVGGGADDYLHGDDGNDTLNAGDGEDGVFGDAGSDTMAGESGSDYLYGGPGDDGMNGGAGNDVFYAEGSADGADSYTGDTGHDTVNYSYRSEPVTILVDDIANDGFIGEHDDVRTDIEYVYAGSAADSLVGSDLPDQFSGNGGADSMDGGAGDDGLYGGDGTDFLTGGEGYDTVYGGNDDDSIDVNDGEYDYVDCGPGNDTVNEDAYDQVYNCEF